MPTLIVIGKTVINYPLVDINSFFYIQVYFFVMYVVLSPTEVVPLHNVQSDDKEITSSETFGARFEDIRPVLAVGRVRSCR